MTIFCLIDDKYVPLYRVMWVAKTPHFCGEEDCEREGEYEVRLEQDESVWATLEQRDALLAAMEAWHSGLDVDDEPELDVDDDEDEDET